MIALPILESLAVRGYGLYPGQSDGGVEVAFPPGLTLILGANGLGKTTLVTMLYRLLTGPFDMRGGANAELGSQRIEAIMLAPRQRRLFAARVSDGAASSEATLTCQIGEVQFVITRSLANLALTRLVVGQDEVEADEEAFQTAVQIAAGVTSFGDWLLLLKHLVFYFEDRRALVWDPSAQRQLLRILFLPSDVSDEWRGREREILTLDSRMRNLRSALTREQVVTDRNARSLSSSGEVRAQIGALQELQTVDRPRLQSLEHDLLEAETYLQEVRLDALKADMDAEHAFRDLERLQLVAIDAAFPEAEETVRYLYAKLFSDHRCLSCGNVAHEAATAMQERLASNQCVVCGTTLRSEDVLPISGPAIESARERLGGADDASKAVRLRLTEAEEAFRSTTAEFRRVSAAVAEREEQIARLVDRLPPAEAALRKQEQEVAALRSIVTTQTEELATLRNEFAEFLDGVNRTIASYRDQIAERFQQFAGGFLLEACELVWSLQRNQLGQSGDAIDFPGFELELTGADRREQTRRHGPDQVSESQREFIDLAFRMTLMTTASARGVGSLVIDAPESSLDAVFVSRAAKVLSRFGSGDNENRLVITSNLIEGDLIPALMREASIEDASDERVVDLLQIAAPTAAVRLLRDEYADVRARLFRRAREPE